MKKAVTDMSEGTEEGYTKVKRKREPVDTPLKRKKGSKRKKTRVRTTRARTTIYDNKYPHSPTKIALDYSCKDHNTYITRHTKWKNLTQSRIFL